MKVNSVLKRSLESKSPVKLSVVLIFLIALSCQKDDFNRNLTRAGEIDSVSEAELPGVALVNFFDWETFTITDKDALVQTRILGNPEYFEKLFIIVQNGNSGQTKTTKLEILIDGIPVVTFADFRKNLNIIQKEITLVKEASVLSVKLDGSRRRFVKIKIAGYLKNTVVSDIDGNFYHTVRIGDQLWMAENLKTTKYNDGTSVPFRTFDADTPDSLIFTWNGYSWYNNDPRNKDIYGALYRMNTFKSGKLCPAGWHAPNNTEWGYLTDFLGGPSEAGGKLKESGTAHWDYPNTGATNESGFTALPGGRLDYYTFSGSGKSATFWSTSKCGGSKDCGWSVTFSENRITWSDAHEEVGYSVRCVYGEQPMIPEVETMIRVSNITATEAKAEFSVRKDYGLTIIQSGVCWGTSIMPSLNDPHTSDGSGLMTNLTPGTQYYVRGYATSSAGTGYGMSIPFTTMAN